jgi:A/G-specific adenine glycosylase
MFLITAPDGRCLLEQRPPDGVWGGLWTPPERPATTAVTDLCREFCIDADDLGEAQPGEPFRHTFSHFHLDIEPVFLRLQRPVTGVAERPDRCWYAPGGAGAPALGLSAPAARLLAKLSSMAPARTSE